MAIDETHDNSGEFFSELINHNLNKLFIKDINITLMSYKLLHSVEAVILDYSDNILSIRFHDFSDIKNLIEGDPIVINFISNHTIYVASATIISSFSVSLDLKIEKISTKDEQRNSKRFIVGLSGNINYKNDNNFIIIKNISSTGLSFISKTDIPLTSILSLTINTHEFFEIEFTGKIIHKSSLIDMFSYGIVITDISQKHREKLNLYIQSLY